jgi:hypothetical protein
MRGDISVDEVLALIAYRGRIMVKEVQDTCRIDSKALGIMLDFLTKFGFAKVEGQSIILSNASASFFKSKDKL